MYKTSRIAFARGNAGFSMIQAMAAAAVVAGLGLVVAQMTRDSGLAMKRTFMQNARLQTASYYAGMIKDSAVRTVTLAQGANSALANHISGAATLPAFDPAAINLDVRLRVPATGLPVGMRPLALYRTGTSGPVLELPATGLFLRENGERCADLGSPAGSCDPLKSSFVVRAGWIPLAANKYELEIVVDHVNKGENDMQMKPMSAATLNQFATGGDSFWAANGPAIHNTNIGRVGIATSNPGALLDVNAAAGGSAAVLRGQANQLYFQDSTPNANQAPGVKWNMDNGHYNLQIINVAPENDNVGNTIQTPFSMNLDMTSPLLGSVLFGGRVGIGGTTVPASHLHVGGNNSPLWIDGIQYPGYVTIAENPFGYSLTAGRILATQYVNAHQFWIDGTCTYGDCSSDSRLKDHVRPFRPGLAALLKIRPVYFRYNGLGGLPKSERDAIGVLADDLEKAAPELVSAEQGKLRAEDEETQLLKKVKYTGLPYLVLNAVKELYAKWYADHEEVLRLRADNAALKAWVCTRDPAAVFCPTEENAAR